MSSPPPDRDAVLAPSQTDPVARGASRVTAGPHGRRADGRAAWWWTPLRAVLVLTVLTSVLGFLAKAPCRTHAWSDEYQYTRMCYTDVYALYFAEHLGDKVDNAAARLSVPYRDHPVEYPSVIGGLMWAASGITNMVRPDDGVAGHPDHRAATFFDITALMLAGFALLTTWAVARLAGRRRVWDAAMFALAPTLLFHLDTNWDMAAVAFAMLALWAWSRPWRDPWPAAVAGAFIGIGTATKLYPSLLLLALLFLCWRAARLRAWLIAAGTSVLAFVVAYLPAVLLSGQTPPALRAGVFQFPDAQCSGHHYLPGWRWFWQLNTTRGSDWDSLWFQVEHYRGTLDSPACGHPPFWLNLGVGLATLVVIGAVSLLVLGAARRPRVPQVAFLLIAGFLLVNKVDSPQYVLWLVPLAVLARPRWPAFLAWQAAELLLVVTRFLFFVREDTISQHLPPAGLPIGVFFATVILRDLTLLVLMGLVVREVLRPDLDVVRADDVDDPAGGPLDGAPDRWDRPAAVHARPAPA